MSFETQIEQKIKQGIGLARDNKREEAEAIFGEVLTVQPDNETALIWKAAVANNPTEAVRCLERALQINPHNQRARAGLEWAQRRLQASKISQFPGNMPETELDSSQPSISVEIKPPSHLVNNLTELPVNRTQPPVPKAVVSPPPAVKPTPASAPPQTSPTAPKNAAPNSTETLNVTPPYKKSRFKLPQSNANTLRPSDEPKPAVAQPFQRNRGLRVGKFGANKRFGRGNKQPKLQATAFGKGAPTAVSLSDKVRQQDFERPVAISVPNGQVKLAVPLALFVAALILGFLTFPFASFSPILGVLALLLALVGVLLFNRSEF